MNIVVIGSCLDSSNLAKELNKRLQNSIVARVDTLKGVKNLFLDKVAPRNQDNLGQYIGDVETFDIEKMDQKFLEDVKKHMESAFKASLKLSTKNKYFSFSSTFDALTSSFPAGTYSFVKIYSGLINDDMLKAFIESTERVENTIFIKFKDTKSTLLPIEISEDTINALKEDSFSFIECANTEEVIS